MKIIIAGSRYADFCINDIQNAVKESGFIITEIVSGHAPGVDSLGEEFAKLNNIDLKIFPADWKRYKKRAGYLRNKEMGLYADGLIALWDGKSKGTKHMIDIMEELNKPYYLYYNFKLISFNK